MVSLDFLNRAMAEICEGRASDEKDCIDSRAVGWHQLTQLSVCGSNFLGSCVGYR